MLGRLTLFLLLFLACSATPWIPHHLLNQKRNPHNTNMGWLVFLSQAAGRQQCEEVNSWLSQFCSGKQHLKGLSVPVTVTEYRDALDECKQVLSDCAMLVVATLLSSLAARSKNEAKMNGPSGKCVPGGYKVISPY